jgi:hypothetical protein
VSDIGLARVYTGAGIAIESVVAKHLLKLSNGNEETPSDPDCWQIASPCGFKSGRAADIQKSCGLIDRDRRCAC